ncbi:MAG TPA: RagB/SusD family nutrient uptake outer membrane protein [Pseudobacter sp.]|nr:RagB/SusD family nutrient uptake outer membrane protein [Pseudobacter sp.]
MFTYSIKITVILLGIGCCLLHQSCSKVLEVDPPINSITTREIFSSDDQANMAIAAVYSTMVNSDAYFSNKGVTIAAGLSADELYSYFGSAFPEDFAANTNKLQAVSTLTESLWSSAYKIIYYSNSIIEGIAESTSGTLTEQTRMELTGEAKLIRAFSYFYLTNLFGDVPLALTVDFNKTQRLPKAPQQEVYRQIVQDLKDAQAALREDYSVAGTGQERIRANKWVATALLARVYLYLRDYANAAANAKLVLDQVGLYTLEMDLDKVFLSGSKEAIWQFKQTPSHASIKNATMEGNSFNPVPLATGRATYCLTDELLNAFEENDQRRVHWTSNTDNSDPSGNSPGITIFPYKYKVGTHNSESEVEPPEYYVGLRLAEIYLIHAEAQANGAAGGPAAAIDDLNVLRRRAGLDDLPATLTQSGVITAVAKERQVELFAEWGHRWLDLNRTDKASAVLSDISLKQPWLGDYQLRYPIPPDEINRDPVLIQNDGY